MGCGSSTPQYTEGGGGRTGRPNSNDLTIKPLKPEKPPHSFSGSGYDNQKVLLKVILLGDSGVGKTSVMNQFCTSKFNNVYKATIGADFLTKEITVDKRKVTLQIWDTAGQERYESLGSAFYRGADACILMFDVNKIDSMERLSAWKEKFLMNSRSRSKSSDDAPAFFAVMGNQIDLGEKARQVPIRSAEGWCKENGNMPYFETSAKEGTNVREAFTHIARKCIGDIMEQESHNQNLMI